jgi:7-cyano-7-deazaguanine synthase
MDVVTLLSGGLDSAVVATLIRDEGLQQLPIFVDYGQRARDREWQASQKIANQLGLSVPIRIDVSGYGATVPSGLTDSTLRIREDAFLPGRNLMFLLLGAAHAYRIGARAVAIGHLSDGTSLFPDQTEDFRRRAAEMLELALGRPLSILAPLASFSKVDVIALAQEKGVDGTWSCHADGDRPCGICIACLEFPNAMPA